MHNLIYGGINSEDYKAYITNAGIYKSPEKRYKKYTVPGRNGVLLEDTGTFENVEVEYPFCVYENCDTNYRAYIAALKRKKGYQRIEDTFHPEYYRMGAFLDEFEPKEVTSDGEMCNGVLKFDCMPQKWLKSGEEPMIFWTTAVIPSEETASGKDEIHSGIFDFATISRNISLTITCPAAETILVTYHSLSYDPIEQETTIITANAVTCRNGDTIVLNYDSTATCGDFDVLCSDSDTVSAIVHCILSEGSDFTEMDIPFATKYTFVNPTGFIARPLIVFGGLLNADITLKNYLDDQVKETYSLYAETNVLIERNKTYLDCDSMYMYNENGENITQQLHITTAIDNTGKSLVFPRFLGEEIEIETNVNSTSFDPGFIPLVWVYPRWWEV